MFSTQGQEVKGGLEKSLQPGVVYAHIHSALVRTASTGKKMLELTLEGPALSSFEGWAVDKNNPEGEKFKGQSSKVGATIYISEFNNDDINKNDILNKLIVISNELGLRKEIDGLAKDGTILTVEQWVEKAVSILKEKDLYFFLAGVEEEYNGKTITKLKLPKYKFCSKDENKLPSFDKTNKYHFTPLLKSPVSGFEPADNDFNM